MVLFPKLEFLSCDFGVFMCTMLEFRCNMDGKKKLLHILSLRWSKQHIDCCFRYSNDKEVNSREFSQKLLRRYECIQWSCDHRNSLKIFIPLFMLPYI